MPNNTNLYNAIISGAVGGSQERWITTAVPNELISSILTIATAIDAIIDPGSYSGEQVDLMRSIVQGIYASRYPTASDANVSQGIATLFLQSVDDLSAETLQANWFVDPIAGDDSNSGSASFPLKTGRRLGQLLSNKRFITSTVVTLLSNLPADDPINIIGSQVDLGKTFTILGADNIVATATIVTVAGRATPAEPWALETSGIDWTTITPGEVYVRLPGGGVGWLGKVIDANNVEVSTFQGKAADDNITPLATEVLSVIAPITVETMSINILASYINTTVFTNPSDVPIILESIDLNGDEQRTSDFTQIYMFACASRNSRVRGDVISYRSCLRDMADGIEFACRDDSTILVWDGGLMVDFTSQNSWIPGGIQTYLNNFNWFLQTGIFLASSLYFNTRDEIYMEEWPYEAINGFSISNVLLGKVVSGTSAVGTSRGITTTIGQVIGYVNGQQPTVSGAIADTTIGGVNTAYASIPFFNTANGAGLVVFA